MEPQKKMKKNKEEEGKKEEKEMKDEEKDKEEVQEEFNTTIIRHKCKLNIILSKSFTKIKSQVQKLAVYTNMSSFIITAKQLSTHFF